MNAEKLVENRFVADEFADRIETFKADIFFPDFTPPENIKEVIQNISKADVLKTLGPEDLNQHAVLLASYSLFLTQEENRLNSYINWCEANIKFIVGRELENAFGSYYQEKELWIRAHNVNAADLSTAKLSAQVKLDSIKYIAQKVQYLSERLEGLSYAKSRAGR